MFQQYHIIVILPCGMHKYIIIHVMWGLTYTRRKSKIPSEATNAVQNAFTAQLSFDREHPNCVGLVTVLPIAFFIPILQ